MTKKSKIFVGSSVEGLDIAYAVQKNLRHEAEVTVWNQGIFEISMTSIESLVEVLDHSDFGIFIFSPDDEVTVRDKENLTVRDNVIFELGLFIGRLGRDRSFIFMPEKNDFRIPTDLLGVTPGTYETDRSDDRWEAATGPACNEVRKIIKKLGSRANRVENPNSTIGNSKEDKESSDSDDWLLLKIQKKYKESRERLEKLILDEQDEDKKLTYKLWIAQTFWDQNIEVGKNQFETIIENNPKDSRPYSFFASTLIDSELFDEAIKVLERGINNVSDSLEDLELAKIDCYGKIGQRDEAIDYLQDKISKDENTEKFYLKLTEYYLEEDNTKLAHKTIHEAYLKYSSNEEVIFKYSKILEDLSDHESALFLRNKLIKINPNDFVNWGYFGNSCLSLELNDRAMNAYEKGNEMVENGIDWLLGNIGNLYKNQGFYTKAIEFLKKSIEKNNNSEYVHDRLSTSFSLKEEETEKFNVHIKSGRVKIRNMKFDEDE